MKTKYYILILILFISSRLFSQGVMNIESGVEMNIGSSPYIIVKDINLSINGVFNTDNETLEFISTTDVVQIPSVNMFEMHIVDGNEVVMGGDLNIVSYVDIEAGILNLNSNNIYLEPGASINENDGLIYGDLGYLEITNILNNVLEANPGNLGFEISTLEDMGSTLIRRGHTKQYGNSNSGIKRYFDVVPTNNSNLDATIVFHYDESELDGIDESSLVLFKSTDGGVTWINMGGTVDVNNNTISLAGVNSFSRWTAAANDSPLPVELLKFEAKKVNSDALLTWQTATENNNDHFVIERSLDGSDFKEIGIVMGSGTSNSIKNYDYTDNNVTENYSNKIFYYRLKQVDYDGKMKYSNIRMVNNNNESKYIVEFYPNPTNGLISIVSDNDEEIDLKIYDSTGRLVFNESLMGNSTLNLDYLNAGIYNMVINSMNYHKSNMLIIK